MPNYAHKVSIDLPIQSVWSFVSVMDHWAPLVPGYMNHEIINEKESTWKFKSDLGVMKKKVHLKVEIISWEEPTKVTFNLTGINEKFVGSGYFEAQAIDSKNTVVTGCLDITAEGTISKMVNSILNKNLPEMTKELTEAVAAKARETEIINR
ncbi:CoxG family protein [Metabacillus herbersteinensis]|uniref:CoxG family protein n=1 Tax=Metabacillus herbersteinensis TaxID=283816 RepID=A0ABV6GJ36_9BACI